MFLRAPDSCCLAQSPKDTHTELELLTNFTRTIIEWLSDIGPFVFNEVIFIGFEIKIFVVCFVFCFEFNLLYLYGPGYDC